MSLRKKTLLTIGTITLILIGLLMLVIRVVLLSNYNQLQEENTRHVTEMVQSELDNEVDRLNSSVEDWAYWDDTYQFALEKNPEYIEANLMDSVFDNLNWNFFAILSNTGDLIYLQEYDLTTSSRVSSDPNVQNWLETDPILRPQSNMVSGHHGILVLPGKPLLVSAAPILPSSGEGPDAGKLVVGRYLIAPDIQHQQTITYLGVNDSNLPPDFQTAKTALENQGEPVFVEALNKEKMASYFTLPDFDNNPALLVKVESNRDIYREGIHTISFFIIFFIVLGVLFGGLVLYALEKGILSRLDVIYSGIRNVGESRDLSQRIHLKGGDELTELAERINETLSALQTSDHALTENEERFKYDALHDALTALPNRVYFMQKLSLAAEKTKITPKYSAAVLFIDLDRFKLINDSFNHEVGDQTLISIRDRIRSSLRAEDFFARLGGDEFAILLDGVCQPDSAAEVANRIQRQLMSPFNIQGHNLFLTASIGIAFTSPSLAAKDILRNADMAMYRAKANGRAQHAQYETSMHSINQNLLQIENDLRLAIKNNEFTLHYQPIVSLKNGRIVAAEALIRWLHPTMGLIYPGEFIPVAEETGLILPISKWVMQTACCQLKAWQAFSPVNLQIAINLSARELQDRDFLNFVEEQHEKSQITCQFMQIEITESTGMADIDLATHTLTKLKSLGAHIAIDDFGTGYSSLAYLTRLPVSSIKIDRSFIGDIEQNPENRAIVSATIAMAHALDLEVVAEGVETIEQMEFLRSKQCDLAQGFFFCRPMPAEILSKYMENQQQIILKNMPHLNQQD